MLYHCDKILSSCWWDCWEHSLPVNSQVSSEAVAVSSGSGPASFHTSGPLSLPSKGQRNFPWGIDHGDVSGFLDPLRVKPTTALELTRVLESQRSVQWASITKWSHWTREVSISFLDKYPFCTAVCLAVRSVSSLKKKKKNKNGIAERSPSPEEKDKIGLMGIPCLTGWSLLHFPSETLYRLLEVF